MLIVGDAPETELDSVGVPAGVPTEELDWEEGAVLDVAGALAEFDTD